MKKYSFALGLACLSSFVAISTTAFGQSTLKLGKDATYVKQGFYDYDRLKLNLKGQALESFYDNSKITAMKIFRAGHVGLLDNKRLESGALEDLLKVAYEKANAPAVGLDVYLDDGKAYPESRQVSLIETSWLKLNLPNTTATQCKIHLESESPDLVYGWAEDRIKPIMARNGISRETHPNTYRSMQAIEMLKYMLENEIFMSLNDANLYGRTNVLEGMKTSLKKGLAAAGDKINYELNGLFMDTDVEIDDEGNTLEVQVTGKLSCWGSGYNASDMSFSRVKSNLGSQFDFSDSTAE